MGPNNSIDESREEPAKERGCSERPRLEGARRAGRPPWPSGAPRTSGPRRLATRPPSRTRPFRAARPGAPIITPPPSRGRAPPAPARAARSFRTRSTRRRLCRDQRRRTNPANSRPGACGTAPASRPSERRSSGSCFPPTTDPRRPARRTWASRRVARRSSPKRWRRRRRAVTWAPRCRKRRPPRRRIASSPAVSWARRRPRTTGRGASRPRPRRAPRLPLRYPPAAAAAAAAAAARTWRPTRAPRRRRRRRTSPPSAASWKSRGTRLETLSASSRRGPPSAACKSPRAAPSSAGGSAGTSPDSATTPSPARRALSIRRLSLESLSALPSLVRRPPVFREATPTRRRPPRRRGRPRETRPAPRSCARCAAPRPSPVRTSYLRGGYRGAFADPSVPLREGRPRATKPVFDHFCSVDICCFL